MLLVLPAAAGITQSRPLTGLGFARAGEQGQRPRQNMTHFHVCVLPCCHVSFCCSPSAELRVTELRLCSLAFPSLMSPGSCLSLTPLLSVSLGSLFCLALSFLLSLVYAATPLPQQRVHCTKSLFSPCVCYLQFGFCLY